MWEERLHKLSDADRERIVQFHQDGMTNHAIAKRFGVSDALVSRILDDASKTPKPGGFGIRIGFNEL
jgi:DNA-binding transcriptional regulator LsrR (DeoR family)